MTEKNKFGGMLFQVVDKDKKRVVKEKCRETRKDEENYEISSEKKKKTSRGNEFCLVAFLPRTVKSLGVFNT